MKKALTGTLVDRLRRADLLGELRDPLVLREPQITHVCTVRHRDRVAALEAATKPVAALEATTARALAAGPVRNDRRLSGHEGLSIETILQHFRAVSRLRSRSAIATCASSRSTLASSLPR